jgi:hypothetical protein
VSRHTPRTLAVSMGFTALDDGSYFKAEPSLHDGKPVGLILHIHRSRVSGRFQFSITTDGGATAVRSSGVAYEIDRAIITCLVLHEAFELRKEPA